LDCILELGRAETEEEKEEEEVSSSVWEDNWDDDVIEDDFSNQLRYPQTDDTVVMTTTHHQVNNCSIRHVSASSQVPRLQDRDPYSDYEPGVLNPKRSQISEKMR
jgi:hypothetical protein